MLALLIVIGLLRLVWASSREFYGSGTAAALSFRVPCGEDRLCISCFGLYTARDGRNRGHRIRQLTVFYRSEPHRIRQSEALQGMPLPARRNSRPSSPERQRLYSVCFRQYHFPLFPGCFLPDQAWFWSASRLYSPGLRRILLCRLGQRSEVNCFHGSVTSTKCGAWSEERSA